MSAYLSYAPVLRATEAENTSAFPDAPEVTGAVVSRPRSFAADLLRRIAEVELVLAARLERRPAPQRLAA